MSYSSLVQDPEEEEEEMEMEEQNIVLPGEGRGATPG